LNTPLPARGSDPGDLDLFTDWDFLVLLLPIEIVQNSVAQSLKEAASVPPRLHGYRAWLAAVGAKPGGLSASLS
jgi:hypothetical protein